MNKYSQGYNKTKELKSLRHKAEIIIRDVKKVIREINDTLNKIDELGILALLIITCTLPFFAL